MLHYLLQDMPHGGVLGDLPRTASVDTTTDLDFTPSPLTPSPTPSLNIKSRHNSITKSRRKSITKSRRHSIAKSRGQRSNSSESGSNYSSSLSSASLSSAVGYFKHACNNIMTEMKRQQQTPASKSRSSRICDTSLESLRLLDIKNKIKKRIRQLDDDDDADEDDRSLLLMNLTHVCEQIKLQLS